MNYHGTRPDRVASRRRVSGADEMVLYWKRVLYRPGSSIVPMATDIYLLPDKTMVFEFALAGYRDSDVQLEFQGENMVLSACAPGQSVDSEEVIFFNRRLKFSDIPEQKYFVPEDKFDREAARAVFKNGILKITVPPREEVRNPTGVKIEIVNEDD
jgi:HSP20 family molecular chaperone IbpA